MPEPRVGRPPAKRVLRVGRRSGRTTWFDPNAHEHVAGDVPGDDRSVGTYSDDSVRA